MTMETLGQRIVRLRKGLGLSTRGLATRVGSSHSVVTGWEQDEYPPQKYLAALALALEVTVEELLAHLKEPEPGERKGKAATTTRRRHRYVPLAAFELSAEVLSATFGHTSAIRVFADRGMLIDYMDAAREVARAVGLSPEESDHVVETIRAGS